LAQGDRLNAKQIQHEFRKLQNAEDARHLARFFKTGPGDYGEGDIFLGIRVPAIRRFMKKYAGEIRFSSIVPLLRSKYHEERLLGLLLMVDKFETGDDSCREDIYRTYLTHTEYINNWDLVDLSAPKIVGVRLEKRGRAILYDLAESDLLWDRRIAVVSTFHFIRRNDFSDTLKIAGKLIYDEHDLIHKAAGWMLREVGKRDMNAEETFLRKFYCDMPRTMLRYAIERFPEDLRQRYLKGLV